MHCDTKKIKQEFWWELNLADLSVFAQKYQIPPYAVQIFE